MPQGRGDNARSDTLPYPSFCPLKNEKVLQDILKQQEEHMMDLIDKSGEVTVRAGPGGGGSGGCQRAPPQHLLPPQRLNGEVSQLRRSLQRAETEAKVLWEEVRGQEPKVDAARVQERILMRQEVRPRGAGPGVAMRRPRPHRGVASGCGETSSFPLASITGGQTAPAAPGEDG